MTYTAASQQEMIRLHSREALRLSITAMRSSNTKTEILPQSVFKWMSLKTVTKAVSVIENLTGRSCSASLMILLLRKMVGRGGGLIRLYNRSLVMRQDYVFFIKWLDDCSIQGLWEDT